MRLIDADALERVLDMIPCADIKNMDGQAYVLVRLSQVYNVIKNAPTIEPERKKGKWTTEEMAELLFNMFGDECACSFSGIDEWLPESCKYAETTCPEPTEKHGCWMQFLLQGGADMRGEQE